MHSLAMLMIGLLAAVGHASPSALCDKASRQGWRITPEGALFPPWYLKPSIQLDTAAIDGMERFLAALTARNINLVVVLIPPPPLATEGAAAVFEQDALWTLSDMEASYYAMERWLESNGAVVVPVLGHARNMPLDQPFFFARDHHWTADGSRATARAVADVLRADARFGSVPHRTFATRKVQDLTLEAGGSAAQIVQKRCDLSFPDIQIPIFHTRPTSPLQLGLLDEAPPDPVVLLGSSYSLTKFNFSGFVQEFSELPVLNVAVSGGRVMGAPLTYFSSDDYAAAPPTWVVWEMATAVEALPNNGATPVMGAMDTYRELVPAVHGRCASPVLQGTAPLKPGVNHLFTAPSNGPMAGGHYLALDPSDATPGPLNVVTRFADGTIDRFKLGRYARVETLGAHFLELPVHQTAAIETVQVEATDAASGTLAYQLCAY
ncbi:MAG TPA: hypothetical protein DFR83_26735 [Deltaproteobacteria bacterium]|nr:hypothetical protein [Deltaproteobacteria bacterium]